MQQMSKIILKAGTKPEPLAAHLKTFYVVEKQQCKIQKNFYRLL